MVHPFLDFWTIRAGWTDSCWRPLHVSYFYDRSSIMTWTRLPRTNPISVGEMIGKVVFAISSKCETATRFNMRSTKEPRNYLKRYILKRFRSSTIWDWWIHITQHIVDGCIQNWMSFYRFTFSLAILIVLTDLFQIGCLRLEKYKTRWTRPGAPSNHPLCWIILVASVFLQWDVPELILNEKFDLRVRDFKIFGPKTLVFMSGDDRESLFT